MKRQTEKLVLAGTTTLLAEPILAALHTGGVGAIVGLAAGAVAYSYYDELKEKLVTEKGEGAEEASSPALREEKPRSLAYRLLNGKSTRATPQGGEDTLLPPFSTQIVTQTPNLLQEASHPVQAALAVFDEEVWRRKYPASLYLGAALWPHANDLLSNRVTILGQPGAGKSNAVAVLCEELARFDCPLIIFDTKPEYAVLCQRPYFKNPFLATVEHVSPSNAKEFAFRIMNERLQVVIDLTSFRDNTTAALTMASLVNALWEWEASFPNEERLPCTIILDEAHIWLPQNSQMSTVSRQERDGKPSPFTQLQQAFFPLITGGRSMGLGCVISTQRPADIDKRAIAVAEWRFLLKTDFPNDMKVYTQLGVDPDMAMALAKGEAYVRAPNNVTGVYQLRKRKSPDDAKTPGLSNLQRQLSFAAPSTTRTTPPSVPLRSMEQDEGERKLLRSETKGSEGEVPLHPLPELKKGGRRGYTTSL